MKQIYVTAAVLGFLGIFVGGFSSALRPVVRGATAWAHFEVQPGEGFRRIVDRLADAHLIRSSLAFKALSLVTGSAMRLKAGTYRLNPSMSSIAILHDLVQGADREEEVTIPEGSSIYEIDALLGSAGVLHDGGLIAFAAATSSVLEGKLFPDTYRFFGGSRPEEVVQKMRGNFDTKAAPILGRDPHEEEANLIVASLVQEEVPDPHDQRLVAGILLKRLEAGMPLQVDATICYVKKVHARDDQSCYPLSPLDYKLDSPYNTYLHRGLPPGPIGNPGSSAIEAVVEPQSSPYWYYLSDPATGKTIFARTLDEQERNKVKYLGTH